MKSHPTDRSVELTVRLVYVLVLFAVLLSGPIGCSKATTAISSAAGRSLGPAQVTRTPILTWHDAVHPAPTHLPANAQTGILAVSVRVHDSALRTQAIPASTATLEFILSGTQLEIPFRVLLTAEQLLDGQAVFSVSNLPPGTFTMDVVARDVAGKALATGRATVTISSSSILRLDLLLTTPPSAGEGHLVIAIDTPVVGSPGPRQGAGRRGDRICYASRGTHLCPTQDDRVTQKQSRQHSNRRPKWGNYLRATPGDMKAILTRERMKAGKLRLERLKVPRETKLMPSRGKPSAGTVSGIGGLGAGIPALAAFHSSRPGTLR